MLILKNITVLFSVCVLNSSCITKEVTSTVKTHQQLPSNDDEGVALARAIPIEREIHVLINKYRASKGLKPLKMNVYMIDQCRLHSGSMADKKTKFGHDGFDNRVKILESQIADGMSWAENVAYNQLTAKEVVAAWLRSPGHKKNIDGDFNLTGIGVVSNKKGELYFTQMFIKQVK